MRKRQLATHISQTPILLLIKVTTEEKISTMYGQKYSADESGAVGTSDEFDLKVYGTMDEERVESVQNTTGDHSMLLLLVIGDCVANNRSQAEVAKKYGIPKSRIQRMMSRKREHMKGGKQYQQEKKRASEEGSIPEKKAKMSEPEIVEAKTTQTPEPEREPSDNESDSNELPDVKL